MDKIFKNLKPKKSFTLIEVLISVFILTVGVVVAFGSIAQTLSAISYARDRLIASYLAQEGIEIVKNIRDSNWIRARNWTTGMHLNTDQQADYRNFSLNAFLNSRFSLTNSLGYHYGIDNQTRFSRKIRVDQVLLQEQELEITVQVFWLDKVFEVKSRITNWLE